MTKNMGAVDRTLRILITVGILLLYLTNVVSGTIGIILGVVAIIFVLTSLVGYCPLYTLLGLSTCSKEAQ